MSSHEASLEGTIDTPNRCVPGTGRSRRGLSESPGTVNSHVENVIIKLRVSDHTQAGVKALEQRILELSG
jgi:hypothetical protein